jgi:hypothetical protein
MPYLLSLDDVTQAVNDRVVAQKSTLGFRQVYYADNNFTPQYPNAVVVHGRQAKTRHSTGNRFLYTFSVFVYVLHANMNLTKAMRSKADIQLAEATGAVIEGSDFSLGGQVIECYVEAIEPALLPARKVGENVVSSRITVYASSVG